MAIDATGHAIPGRTSPEVRGSKSEFSYILVKDGEVAPHLRCVDLNNTAAFIYSIDGGSHLT